MTAQRNGKKQASAQPSPWRTPAFQALAQPLGMVLGAQTAKALGSLRLHTVGDLMTFQPRRYFLGTQTTNLAEVVPGEDVAVVARVARQEIRTNRDGHSKRLEVLLTDGNGRLNVTFFARRAHLADYWARQLSMGVKGIFVGKVGEFNGQLQMTHPNFVMLDGDGNIVGAADEKKASMVTHVNRSGLVGIYPATSRIPTWSVGEYANFVLDGLAGLPDPMPEALRLELELPELSTAYQQIHRPVDARDPDLGMERLKLDEVLALQVTMARRRREAITRVAPVLASRADGLLAAFDTRLPYQLTDSQQRVGAEINADLRCETPMQRLLQGEVGSGKTIVALRAMLTAVDSGHQAVLLAPTEVLATQHHSSIIEMLGDLGQGRVLGAPESATEVVLLTGSMTATQRRERLAKVASGEAGIIVGTHAVLGSTVHFASLGLVVVDEQHRFGVEQRAILTDRHTLAPHQLVLTATPIPRSIAMTVFGDLEVSILDQLPAGRQEVQTSVVHTGTHPGWLERAWQRIREEVAAGHQVFIVAPRIDADDDGAGLASVVELHTRLSQGPLRGLRTGLLHGRLPVEEKDATMAAFVAGYLDVLVSTTVIEVGVDVPNATMMVIMDADRFGISQLHQLRGRIGRGQYPGVCLLVTAVEPGSVAAGRLSAVAATRDGFALAELDLAQRREGDVLGSSQAGGRSTLRLLRVTDDANLIAMARQIAERIVDDTDPDVRAWCDDMVTRTLRMADAEWMERG